LPQLNGAILFCLGLLIKSSGKRGDYEQTSANNVTRTMVYDVFGQLVADYLITSSSTLERENIYREGELLAVYGTGASCYKLISP